MANESHYALQVFMIVKKLFGKYSRVGVSGACPHIECFSYDASPFSLDIRVELDGVMRVGWRRIILAFPKMLKEPLRDNRFLRPSPADPTDGVYRICFQQALDRLGCGSSKKGLAFNSGILRTLVVQVLPTRNAQLLGKAGSENETESSDLKLPAHVYDGPGIRC